MLFIHSRGYMSNYLDEVARQGIQLDRNGVDSVDHLLMEADFYALYLAFFYIASQLAPKDLTSPVHRNPAHMSKFLVSSA